MATTKQTIDIIARDKTGAAFGKVNRNINQVNTGMGQMKKLAIAAGGALAALGVGRALKNIVRIGSEIETLELRLNALFGSTEEGAKAFDVMTEFASRVPFSLEQISNASGNLAVVAEDANELADVLAITGNVAAITGLDFQTTSEQIQRAFSGGIASADIFREKGVRALLGFEEGAKVSIEETRKAFVENFGPGGEFGGATDQFANTLAGTISMLQDKLFKFQSAIAEGFFGQLKKSFGDLDKFFADNEKTILEVATSIGEGLAEAIRVAANGVIFLKDNFNTLITAIKLLISFKIASVFVGLAGGILKANSAMLLFNATIKRNLFIAGAAIVISQFDKILEVLGKIPKDFDTASAAIQSNNEQISILENQLSLAEAQLGLLIKQYGEDTKIKEFADQIQQQKDLIAETTKEIENLKAMNDALYKDSYPVYEDRIMRLNRTQKEIIEQNEEEKKTVDTSMQAYHEYGMQKRRFLKIQNEAIIKQQNLNQAVGRFPEAVEPAQEKIRTFSEALVDGFTGALPTVKDTLGAIENVGVNAFNSLADGLAKFVMTGKFNFKDFANSVIQDILRIAAKLAILFAIQAFTGIPVFTAATGLPGKAAGGPVGRNKPVVVGERGPELFVPKAAGTVLSNTQSQDALSGNNGPVTVNFNIVANDTRGFDELLMSRRATIQGIINGALHQRGKMGVV